MQTKIWEKNQIEEAVKALQENEVICFPTETVYGIGVISNSQAAFDKLVQAKRRPPEKPFTLMCSSIEEALPYIDADEKALRVMKQFMPGEITLLLRSKKGNPHWIDLGTPLIGIRIPNSQFVLDLIHRVGHPCLVTSANHSGEPTSTKFEETYKVFNGEVYGIVKGECVSNLASTIVNLGNEDKISLVREGKLPFETIKNIWEGKE